MADQKSDQGSDASRSDPSKADDDRDQLKKKAEDNLSRNQKPVSPSVEKR